MSLRKVVTIAALLTLAISFSASAQSYWTQQTSGRIVNNNGAGVDLTGTATLMPFNGAGTGAFFLSDSSAAAFIIRSTNGPMRFDTPSVFKFSTELSGVWTERMRITAAGDVGIGTGTPQSLLDVAGTTTTEVLEITGGSDLAEHFNISNVEAVPGMVACIDPENPGQLRLSSTPYDRTVVGVISGAGGVKPGMLMGQEGNKLASGAVPVALTGRVYVQADAANGTIQPGDLLTTSSTAGHVMKVTDHDKAVGAILGKAMTGIDEETGLVLMVVALQ